MNLDREATIPGQEDRIQGGLRGVKGTHGTVAGGVEGDTARCFGFVHDGAVSALHGPLHSSIHAFSDIYWAPRI